MTATMIPPPPVMAATTRRPAWEVQRTVRGERWPWLLGAGLFVVYLWLGWWLLYTQKYQLMDSTSRTIGAHVLVNGRDPHLGAMGFYWPPLPMFARVPFVMFFRLFDVAVFGGPASTAAVTAFTVPVLNRIGTHLRLPTHRRITLILLYSLNPIVVFYAANGMSEAWFSLALAFSSYGLLRYIDDRSVGAARTMGLGLALGMLCRVEFIPITMAFVIAVWILTPKGERFGAISLTALPMLFIFAIWSWAARLMTGDWFYWYTIGRQVGSSEQQTPWMDGTFGQQTVGQVIRYTVPMVLFHSAALVPVALAGALRSVNKRAWLAVLGVMSVLPVFMIAQVKAGVNNGAARYFEPMVITGVIGSMWLLAKVRFGDPRGNAAVYFLAVGAAAFGATVTVPLYNDKDIVWVQHESAFFAPLIGRKAPAEADFDRQIKEIVELLDPLVQPGDRIAMTSHGGLAVLYSEHPKQFILPEDRDFEQIMSAPEGRFRFVIRPLIYEPDAYTHVIDAAMESVERNTKATWKEIATNGAAALYQLDGEFAAKE